MVTLYTVTVDTEEEWDWDSGWPTRDLAVRNIRHLPEFQATCARHGAAVTYFTNWAVLDNAQARKTVLDLAAQRGAEIGMHIHPWNTPPLTHSGSVTARATFLHNLAEGVIDAKLTTVYELFRECGLKPTSFRGGRYSSQGAIHHFLRERGFLADASVMPFTTWPDDGAPDYRRRRLLPVRLPPRREGDLPLWEIPLTLAYTRRPFGLWRRVFNAIEHSPLRHLRLIGVAHKLGLVRRVWLNFENPLGEHMLPFLHKLRPLKLPCICFTLHSSSLMVGGNGYTPTQAARERLFAQVNEVLQTVARWEEFVPATVSEVANRLEHDHHARTRD